MKLGRREFLKISGAAAGFTLLQPLKLITPTKTKARTDNQSSIAMLIDVSKCIGCWWCYAACKNYNNLPETIRPDMEEPPELTGDTWTTLFTLHRGGDEWSARKHACMHCEKCCPYAVNVDGRMMVAHGEVSISVSGKIWLLSGTDQKARS